MSIEDRLQRERPVPAAAFRGELRRNLVASAGSETAPARIRRTILAYGLSGSALIAVAAAGVLGAGPLAA